MKAIAIIPGKGDAKLIEVAEPKISKPEEIKLEVLQVGICGTDREEVSGGRAEAPENEGSLIIGHEMLGRVVDAGSAVTKVKKGDYALFIVRRGCGICLACLNGRSDMCLTGKYKERGIKGYHGYQAEFVVDEEQYVIKVPDEIAPIGVLTEPLSVVEKAIAESISLQAARQPYIDSKNWLEGKQVLVAGLGPVGLLGAFILRLHGAKVFGMDIVDENTGRPELLKEIGGKYIDGRKLKAEEINEACGYMDLILEATGIAQLEFQLLDALGINGIYVLTGIPAGERPVTILGSELMRQMVLMNHVLLGSVNASIDHYQMAINDLGKAQNKWSGAIKKLITGKVSFDKFENALKGHSANEIKTIVEWKGI